MRLTDDELRDVLARAEAIQASATRGDAANAEIRAVIAAAEEVGLSRQAVEQALRERFDVAGGVPAVGELAFAESADGKYYVARVLELSENGARVRYLRGSEASVALDRLRACSLVPGTRVVADWPMWGAWTCTVLSYDAEKERVKVSDGWGSTAKVKLTDVWLDPQKAPRPGNPSRARVYATLLGVGAVFGAVVGSVLTLLVR